MAARTVEAARAARAAVAALAARPVRGAVLAFREVRQVVATRFAAGTRAVSERSRGQRLGDVEGTGATAVPGSHRPAGRTGQPGAVRPAGARGTAVRATGAGAARHAHGADHAAGTTGSRPCTAGSGARGGRALRTRTARQTGPVGGAAALTARARPRLAGREPVAGLLLRGRGGLGRGLDRAHGLGHARRRSLGLRGLVGGLGVRDGRTHDDRRNGPRPGDVDPDPGRQCGLGLAVLRLRGRTARIRTGVGSRGCPVRRRARRVCGSAAPVGPGGRSVSFTTQGRFSRLAPPPDTTSRAARRRAPPYWPLLARIP